MRPKSAGATVFSYFNSQEDAVAEGMNAHWLDRSPLRWPPSGRV